MTYTVKGGLLPVNTVSRSAKEAAGARMADVI